MMAKNGHFERSRRVLASPDDVVPAAYASTAWDANLPGSPVIAAQEIPGRLTVFLIPKK
jgi:hypothetical protein